MSAENSPKPGDSTNALLRKVLAALSAGAGAGSGSGGQMSASWSEPVNGTYWLSTRLDRNYRLTRITAQLGAGSCNVQLSTNSGALGAPIAVSTASNTQEVDFTVLEGDYLQVVLTGVSSAATLGVTVDHE